MKRLLLALATTLSPTMLDADETHRRQTGRGILRNLERRERPLSPLPPGGLQHRRRPAVAGDALSHGRGESRGPLSIVAKWGPPRMAARGEELAYIIVLSPVPRRQSLGRC